MNALGYPKFSLNPDEVTFLIKDEILPYFEVTTITEKISEVCKDPDDDMFISCALSASANYIVTGDKALLAVKKYRGIVVVSPAVFIHLL